MIIARFDVLLPDEALAAAIEDRSDGTEHPGVTADRETSRSSSRVPDGVGKRGSDSAPSQRRMASRYFRRMPLLNEKGLTVLGNLLGEAEPVLTAGRLSDLEKKVNAAQKRLKVSKPKREDSRKQIRDFWEQNRPFLRCRPRHAQCDDAPVERAAGSPQSELIRFGGR